MMGSWLYFIGYKGLSQGHQSVDGWRPVSFELLGSLFHVPQMGVCQILRPLLFRTAFSLAILWGTAHWGIGLFFQKGGLMVYSQRVR